MTGSEIKSIRSGKVNIAESYAIERNGEIFLMNSHIPAYKEASYSNHNPTDDRKLLLNKREIKKILGLLTTKGYTAVPMEIFFNEKGLAKVKFGVGVGKKKYDKRESIKQREWSRKKERLLRK